MLQLTSDCLIDITGNTNNENTSFKCKQNVTGNLKISNYFRQKL